MPEESKEINIQKLKEEYPEFFSKTPSEIIEFALSKRTSSQIADICVKSGVEDEEKIEGVAYRIIWVLLKKLPKENLALTLEKGLELDLETAKKISDEANKIIFSQVPSSEAEKPLPQKEEIRKEEAVEEETPKSPKKDIYREPMG